MSEKDRIFDKVHTAPSDFVFDERVVRVFPDMINRSVPGYGLIVPMMGLLARRYACDNSVLYDLGCSLGAVSLAMQGAVSARGVHIEAVDNAPEMISRLKQEVARQGPDIEPAIHPVLQDIRDTVVRNASVVAMNFTLQFVPTGERTDLLSRIRAGMNDGAVMLLSEKIAFDDPQEQMLQTGWHHDFKRTQGYSELEIARKREALENVMIPESLERHRKRLEAAGFSSTYRWFQGFNFVSVVAFA